MACLFLTATFLFMLASAFVFYRAHLLLQQLSAEVKRLRLTHSQVSGIEDATAVIVDVILHQQFEEARLNKALKILTEMRSGPHAYDPEAPAGKRPPITK